ncbi:MAG: zf-TFIIB domain-containing protein [Betaproteobacteria bacterium]
MHQPGGVVAMCPGCRTPMASLEVDRLLLGGVTVDLCAQCHALWFDAMESVQLSPAGTLILFRAIQAAGPPGAPLPETRLPCPRCDTPLDLTQDVQRTTRFTYYRCRRGHGRFTPFVQFLREKNFIKSVSPADLERLKTMVRVIRCASCGAPVDLQHDAACRYCRAPIAILDTAAVAQTLRELDLAAARHIDVGRPDAAAAAVMETLRFERAMAQENRNTDTLIGVDLIGVGLNVVSALLSR